MLDYGALLYDPVYAEIGVKATFTTSLIEVTLTVIDDTRPKVLPAGSAEVRSVGPGAFVRIPELEWHGISRDDWMDASLSFNGRSWVVRSYELRGSPNGEDLGEVRFLLKAVAAVPVWVPANAKIHIDFLGGTPQGRAWSNGAQVAIDTLLGSDPNAENGWGVNQYIPANINVHGYQPKDGDPSNATAFIGLARTMLLNAATIVVRETHNPLSEAPLGTINLVLLSADGVDALEIDVGYPAHGTSGYTWGGNPVLALLISDILNEGVQGALNVLAATVTQTRLDIAVNGSVAQTGTVDAAMRPPVNPLIAVILNGNPDEAIQSITIYDPLPTTAGLSELSLVG